MQWFFLVRSVLSSLCGYVAFLVMSAFVSKFFNLLIFQLNCGVLYIIFFFFFIRLRNYEKGSDQFPPKINVFI